MLARIVQVCAFPIKKDLAFQVQFGNMLRLPVVVASEDILSDFSDISTKVSVVDICFLSEIWYECDRIRKKKKHFTDISQRNVILWINNVS